MEELFRNRASAILMDWLCAFKVRRDGTDRTGIRTAVKRLQEGRVVGVFPEGGIRAGKGSVLEGAPMWPGVKRSRCAFGQTDCSERNHWNRSIV